MPKIKEIFLKWSGGGIIFLALVLNPAWLGQILLGRAIENFIAFLLIVAVEIMLAALGTAFIFWPNYFFERRREILLLIIVSATALAFLEIGARVFWPSTLAGWYGYPPGLFLPDETKGYIYKPNFKGYFPNPPYHNIAIEINSKGLRDNEHSYDKPESVFRILGLGDSITFGSGIPFENTYLRELEKKLRDDGFNAEIIKAGVNSYEFDQEYRYFNEEGYKYNPDIVILGLFLNDISEVTLENALEQKTDMENLLKNEALGIFSENLSFADKIKKYCRLCEISHSVIFAADNYGERDTYNVKYASEHLENIWNTEWPDFEKKLLQFDQELKRQNIKLLLVVFPLTEQFSNSYGLSNSPQNKIIKMAKENKIAVVDLLPHLDIENFHKYYLGGDSIHPNAKGHSLVSDIIYKELIDKKLIRK